MANPVYPQLSVAAIAQYPIRKQVAQRTILNIMRDGRVISLPDPGASTVRWMLSYTGLSTSEATALKALFDACEGPLKPFTFLDPTDNLFAWTSNLSNPVWQRSSLIKIYPNQRDPSGGQNATTVVNNGQSFEDLFQTIPIPANYQYCFSLFVSSPEPSSVVLSRRAAGSEKQTVADIGATWKRIVSTDGLNDGGDEISVGLRLAPGQSITVYGLQLEAQASSSPYRPTTNRSAVHSNCFWAMEQIEISAEAPGLYSMVINVESRI